MQHRYQVSPAVRQAAGQQDGVLTREQALALGVSRHIQQRLVDDGRWQRLAPGILLIHDQQPSWTARAWTGVLLGGDGARLGGLAAAHLHRLIDEDPELITVLIPHERQRVSRRPWTFVREGDGVRNGRSIGAPPRTRIEDTVLDLAADRFGDSAGRTPLDWVTTAVQRRLTTPDRLLAVLQNRQRVRGRSELLPLLAEVDEGAQSPLELLYLRDVERAHGLPKGARQVPVRQAGKRLRRDVRYERFGVLVELDGELGHSGNDRFRDFRRDNAALLGGEVTLRYGWVDVRQHPCGVAVQVATMITRGGWTGRLRRCPRCPETGAH